MNGTHCQAGARSYGRGGSYSEEDRCAECFTEATEEGHAGNLISQEQEETQSLCQLLTSWSCMYPIQLGETFCKRRFLDVREHDITTVMIGMCSLFRHDPLEPSTLFDKCRLKKLRCPLPHVATAPLLKVTNHFTAGDKRRLMKLKASAVGVNK